MKIHNMVFKKLLMIKHAFPLLYELIHVALHNLYMLEPYNPIMLSPMLMSCLSALSVQRVGRIFYHKKFQ